MTRTRLMKNNHYKIITLTTLSFFGLAFFAPMQSFGASANSAQRYFYGTTTAGAMLIDEESPIVVTNEDLTFNIESDPLFYSQEESEYKNTVSAKYTFNNPSEYVITSGLAFPFAKVVDYLDQEIYNDIISQYEVKVNEEVVATSLRHTYAKGDLNHFDLDQDLSRIVDQKKDDEFFNDDLAIYKHNFVMSTDFVQYGLYFIEFTLPDSYQGVIVSSQVYEYYPTNLPQNKVRFAVTRGELFSLYCLGQDISNLDENYSIYSSQNELIAGSVSEILTTTINFEQFIDLHYLSETPINDIDQHNIVIDHYLDGETINHSSAMLKDFTNQHARVLTWYEYEITLQPGQTIINEVIAPLFPNVDSGYEPSIFEYTYLLSPASTWASFSNLNIKINTPYFLIGSNFDDQSTKVEEGYTFSFDSLPEGEFTFSLSSDPNPVRNNSMSMGIALVLLTIFGAAFVLFILIPLIVALVVFFVLRSRKKRPII